MRKLIATIALAAAVLSSCTKEGAGRFEGYYSYKLSGSIQLEATEASDPETAQGPDMINARISSESGQMNILARDKSSGAMVITMNAVAGDAVSFEASAEGDKLTVKEAAKHVSLDNTLIRGLKLRLAGTGERLEDVVIIKFSAAGETEYLGRTYTVKDSEVECIARLND